MAEAGRKGFFVYLLRCADGSLYTGYTVDVDRRLKTHNEGNGARYTRSRRPVTLAAWAALESRHEAMRVEALVKGLPKGQKEALVALWAENRDGFAEALATLSEKGSISI